MSKTRTGRLEEFNHYRQIFTDGRSFPDDLSPAWMGSSIGPWKGDTLVLETAGFNDQTWLDDRGHPHTDALKTTERFRRLNVGSMELLITFADPKAYARPWTIRLEPRLAADSDFHRRRLRQRTRQRTHGDELKSSVSKQH